MTTVNILDFGAVSDGGTMTTDAIQRAIDACAAEGGGEVIVPAGTYLTGDILLRDNITLRMQSGATLLGSRDPMDYFHYRTLVAMPPEDISDEPWSRAAIGEKGKMQKKPRIQMPGCRWNNGLIRAYQAKNIAVIGEKDSVIDGNNTYDAIGEENYRGPHGMSLFGCKGIRLEGYTIQNTGNWAQNVMFSENIVMRGVTSLAGHDGIHVSASKNIVIEDCEFYTGDDAVAGFANTNVLVKNCVLNSACSAFRFGGTNVYATGCHLYGPGRYCFRGSLSPEEKAASVPSATSGHRTNMLSAFTYYADFSLPIENQPGSIVLENCKIEMADRFLHYNYSGNEIWQKNRPLESITFKNIDAKAVSMPITAYGSEEVPLTLKIEDTSITVREGADLRALVHAAGFEKISLRNVKVANFKGDCLVRTWSDGEVVAQNVDAGNAEVKKPAEEVFTARPI